MLPKHQSTENSKREEEQMHQSKKAQIIGSSKELSESEEKTIYINISKCPLGLANCYDQF